MVIYIYIYIYIYNWQWLVSISFLPSPYVFVRALCVKPDGPAYYFCSTWQKSIVEVRFEPRPPGQSVRTENKRILLLNHNAPSKSELKTIVSARIKRLLITLRVITQNTLFGYTQVLSCFHSFVSCGVWVKKQEKNHSWIVNN
jgi:hypothetical protein